jgi:hypothetical protein
LANIGKKRKSLTTKRKKDKNGGFSGFSGNGGS